jgi:hypothetical protein
MLPLSSISCGYGLQRQLKVWFSSCKSRSSPHFLTLFLIASSPLYYITALTALFESVALIVDQHQPIVDKYYGNGKMYNVITRLIQECDRVVKSTLDSFEEERTMQRKVGFLGSMNRGIPANISVQAIGCRCPDLTSAQRTVFCGLQTTNDCRRGYRRCQTDRQGVIRAGGHVWEMESLPQILV